MGAVGNYEIISEPFGITTGLTGTEITVEVPSGKVAVGWGVHHTGTLDGNGAIGVLYVTCAEMGC